MDRKIAEVLKVTMLVSGELPVKEASARVYDKLAAEFRSVLIVAARQERHIDGEGSVLRWAVDAEVSDAEGAF